MELYGDWKQDFARTNLNIIVPDEAALVLGSLDWAADVAMLRQHRIDILWCCIEPAALAVPRWQHLGSTMLVSPWV